MDTNLIQREEQFLFSPANIKPEFVVATAFIEFLSQMQSNQSTQKQLWLAQPLWRSNVSYQHSIKLNYLNQNIQIKFSAAEQGFNAEFNGQQYHITGQLTDQHSANIQIGGVQQKLAFNRGVQGITLFNAGQSYKFSYLRQDYNQTDGQSEQGHLKAPMPGVVTQLLVGANHTVKKDDVLLTLEAMSTWKVGSKVNLEVDVLARYIERLLLGGIKFRLMTLPRKWLMVRLIPSTVTEPFSAKNSMLILDCCVVSAALSPKSKRSI